MTLRKDQVSRLEDWILIEAYKNGMARKDDICARERLSVDGPQHYYIGRHAVYQRFFNLPIDAFLNSEGAGASIRRLVKRRLKSAAILCESVRGLLGAGLIQFPQRLLTKTGRDDSAQTFGNLICLTSAGIQEAESLLAPACDPELRQGIDSPWTGPPRLGPSNAVSSSVS